MDFNYSPEEEKFRQEVHSWLEVNLPDDLREGRDEELAQDERWKRPGKAPVQLFGGLDFQSKRQSQEWSIVAELRKQYEVAQVAPDAAYPGDLDVLLAAQPSRP